MRVWGHVGCVSGASALTYLIVHIQDLHVVGIVAAHPNVAAQRKDRIHQREMQIELSHRLAALRARTHNEND